MLSSQHICTFAHLHRTLCQSLIWNTLLAYLLELLVQEPQADGLARAPGLPESVPQNVGSTRGYSSYMEQTEDMIKYT